MERWLKAVLHHKPGMVDAPLLEVGLWFSEDLRTLWGDTNSVARLTRNLGTRRFGIRGEGPRPATDVSYSGTQLHRIRVLSCAAGGLLDQALCREWGAEKELDADLLELARRAAASRVRGDDNFLLRHAAVLEADVAILAPPPRLELIQRTLAAGSGPERVRVNVSDGQGSNLRQDGLHWEIAYSLLGYIRPPHADKPAPEQDAMVRLWYRATATWMQRTGHYDSSHIARAVNLFPTDPDLLFLRATQHEIDAGPTVQSAMRSAVLPLGVSFGVRGMRTELRDAADFFRRALAARPEWPEAHLRLGRVLALRGEPADAAVHLRQALATTDTDMMRYFGSLFLGAVEESAGRFDDAGALYERAATLFPDAQSSHLALSQLARRRGNRDAALQAIQTVFAIRPAKATVIDPWWIYLSIQAHDADDLLEALRRPLLEEPIP